MRIPINEIVKYQVWEFVEQVFSWQFQINLFKKSIVVELRKESPLMIFKSYLSCPELLKVFWIYLCAFLTVFISVKKFFFKSENTFSVQKNSGMDSCHYVRMEGGDWFLIVIDWVNWLSFSKDSRRVVSIATYRALLIMAPKAETIRKNLYIEHLCDQAHIHEWPHPKNNLSYLQQVKLSL